MKRYQNFHLPYEHGAWWTFEICLAAGLLQAYAHGRNLGAALALGAGMHALFLASDWLTGLGRRRAPGDRTSKPGWLLTASGGALISWGSLLAPSNLRTGLALVLFLWACFVALVLYLRIQLPARDTRLLMASAVLLTGPALVLGGLALGSFGAIAFCYWAPWAWYFAWGLFYIQVWMRGTTLPRWRIQAASVPFLLLALMLTIFSGWLGGLLLLLLSARVLFRLQRRLNEFDHGDGQPHVASSPQDIHRLGYEQLAWSLVLSALWVAKHWGA